MAAGSPGRTVKDEVRVKVPTKNLVSAIISLYQSNDAGSLASALQLAGYIMESYEDHKQMKKDIFATFVSMKSMTIGMRKEVERRFPSEAIILKEIFGTSLFGGP